VPRSWRKKRKESALNISAPRHVHLLLWHLSGDRSLEDDVDVCRKQIHVNRSDSASSTFINRESLQKYITTTTTTTTNNNNALDNVYGADIMTVIARVHSVNLMNVEQCQEAADPHTKPIDLGCESASRLLSSTPTIVIYYYLNRKLISFYHPTEGRRHCSKRVWLLLSTNDI